MTGHFVINDSDKSTLCKKKITKNMYVFKSIGHAYSRIPSPKGHRPCEDCIKALKSEIVERE